MHMSAHDVLLSSELELTIVWRLSSVASEVLEFTAKR